MTQPFYNDQAYIAEGFHLDEIFASKRHASHFSRSILEPFIVKRTFRQTRNELRQSLKETLFNYTEPAIILADTGFFGGKHEN